VKFDKTLISLILIFLALLSEYPILFSGQSISGSPLLTQSVLPLINKSPIIVNLLPSNSTKNTSAINLAIQKNIVVQEKCIPKPLTKTLKDSKLWFKITVPEDWNATTEWEAGDGLYFYTDLGIEEQKIGADGVVERWLNSTTITITTYTITKNQDQYFRNYYREQWYPKPTESIERINGITFNRFESKGNVTAVVYVCQKSSANERGFATLIRYYVSSSGCQEELEQIVHSFRYLSANEANSGLSPGIEISIPDIF